MKKLILTSLFLLGVFTTMTFSAPNVVTNDVTSKSLGQTKSNFHNKCKLSVEVSNFYDKDIVESELKQKDGVNEVYLALDEKIAYVSYDNSITNADKLCKSLNDLGFSSKVIEEASK